MRPMAHDVRQLRPLRPGAIASAAPVAPLPLAAAWPGAVGALLWLHRLLFVRPIGRRAREERLGALDHRQLRDIGLRRADVHASAWGGVSLRDVVPTRPSAAPRPLCGRPNVALSLVRLREAA